MNVNEILIPRLRELVPKVYPGICREKPVPDEYMILAYDDETPEIYSGDQDTVEVTSISVHYFVRGDPTDMKKKIRAVLRGEGFIVGETLTMSEADTGFEHIVVSASISDVCDDYQEGAD